MICPKCQTENPESYVLCRHCNQSLVEKQTDAEVSCTAEAPIKKKKKKSKIFKVIKYALPVLVILAIGYVIIFKPYYKYGTVKYENRTSEARKNLITGDVSVFVDNEWIPYNDYAWAIDYEIAAKRQDAALKTQQKQQKDLMDKLERQQKDMKNQQEEMKRQQEEAERKQKELERKQEEMERQQEEAERKQKLDDLLKW